MNKQKAVEKLVAKLNGLQDKYDLSNLHEIARAVIDLGYRKKRPIVIKTSNKRTCCSCITILVILLVTLYFILKAQFNIL